MLGRLHAPCGTMELPLLTASHLCQLICRHSPSLGVLGYPPECAAGGGGAAGLTPQRGNKVVTTHLQQRVAAAEGGKSGSSSAWVGVCLSSLLFDEGMVTRLALCKLQQRSAVNPLHSTGRCMHTHAL
jgi:hypothetical protein